MRGQASRGDSVMTLRPQAMSVRQASFESNEPLGEFHDGARTQNRSRQELDRLNAEEHRQSFIVRENAAPQESQVEATEMITRVGINLAFVLALAIGGILMLKQFQKGRVATKRGAPSELSGLKIDQVLQVTRGVSLYLVDSMASKILVAVDAGGIKSVNVLPSRFEDQLDDVEEFSSRRESQAARGGLGDSVRQESSRQESSRQGSRRGINKTSSSDIDENLIKLLLTKSRDTA